MSVPEDIRAVPRPTNSVVFNSGSNGPKQYSVRMHNGYKHVEGKPSQPTFGPVIGYIINHQFVQCVQPTKLDMPEIASYGSSALVYSVAEDLYQDLLKVYQPNEALTLMALAGVRVVKPHVSNARAAKEYRSTFLQVYYPKAALSENTIGKLLEAVGENQTKQAEFYKARLMRAVGNHLAVDGTLIQDDSRINDLSAYSRKSRVKNSKDISLMYAYDIERREPVCASVFPGNRPDTSAYPEFIRTNDIRDAIIIDDTGFSAASIRAELADRPDLHYLTPLRRNDSRITNNGMLVFDHVLTNTDEVVYAHKELIQKSKTGRKTWLYSFCNTSKANAEFRGFGAAAKKSGRGVIDPVDYVKKRDFSGVIVFESDLDADLELIYQCYKDRWLIELAFRRYKGSLELDSTKVQSDYSIIGAELVNFVSTVITCRILKKAEHAGVLDEMTYGEMMDDLFQARRKTAAPEDPASQDGQWSCAAMIDFELMEKLGLSRPAVKIGTGKPGRPRKKPALVTSPSVETEVPRPDQSTDQGTSSDDQSPETPGSVKRGPGRPRKYPPKDPDAPKRGPGRPRKYPPKDPNAPKRGPGRPRKYPPKDPNAPKRGPGRPRKYPPKEPNVPKRGPGRPRKEKTI